MVDQGRWDDEMPDLVEAYLDHCHRRQSGQSYSGAVKEKHIILVWSPYGVYFFTAEKPDLTDIVLRAFVLQGSCISI